MPPRSPIGCPPQAHHRIPLRVSPPCPTSKPNTLHGHQCMGLPLLSTKPHHRSRRQQVPRSVLRMASCQPCHRGTHIPGSMTCAQQTSRVRRLAATRVDRAGGVARIKEWKHPKLMGGQTCPAEIPQGSPNCEPRIHSSVNNNSSHSHLRLPPSLQLASNSRCRP